MGGQGTLDRCWPLTVPPLPRLQPSCSHETHPTASKCGESHVCSVRGDPEDPSFTHSFIHSLHGYFLNTYYSLVTCNTSVSRTQSLSL